MHGHWHPGYYRRGPSRLLWFFLGGAAVAWWHYKANPEYAQKRFGWCHRREIEQQQQPRPPVDYSAPPTTSQSPVGPNEKFTKGPWGESREQTESEPLWKLRGEKERERLEREREMEFRENMLKAREKVCSSYISYDKLDAN
jgi:hypothetical protein